MDTMKGLKRTHYCGEVLTAGETVTVGGYVDTVRDKGGIIFIVLRDRTGVVQLTFNETTDKAVFEKASSCHSEYVVMAKGVLVLTLKVVVVKLAKGMGSSRSR